MDQSAYVSSTYEDLRAHRDAVIRVLEKMRFKVVAMEDYVARDNRMVDQVRRDVAECNLYVGIVAWRYGYVPSIEENPEGCSVTEAEYREAERRGKPRLVFLLDPNAPWPRQYMDSITGENGRGARIEQFRGELSQRMHSPFTGPGDLAESAAAAIHLSAVDARTQSLAGDLSSASCLTMLTSARPAIIDGVRQAVTAEVNADVVKVNLGAGREWWSTRLHLLCALCADYTPVREIVFESDGYRYLGSATPSQARRTLAREFPNVEEAYRRSLPAPAEFSFDPVQEVAAIVDRFSHEMDTLGGEEAVKRWIEPHLIRNWPGVTSHALDLGGGGVTRTLVDSVLQRPSPFVVLVRDGIVQKIVDRLALATRVATTAW